MPHLLFPFSERNRHQTRRTLRASKKITTAASAVRAGLVGTNCATALGIEATGPSPVLALCRVLVEAGHDPAAPLLAYRGNTLALKVRSIGVGAKLTVKDDHIGKPVFRRWRHSAEGGAAAPPIAPTAPAKHPVPPLGSRAGGPARQTVSLPRVRSLETEGGDQ
jgi:hypothetical protein